MKKKFTLLLMFLASIIVANAQVIYDETFNYSVANLSAETTWTTAIIGGGVVTGTGRNIITPPLTYSNSGGEYILSGVGKTINSDFTSMTGTSPSYYAYKTFTATPVSSGVVYLSFLYKAGVAQGQTNSEVFGFATGTSAGAKVWVGKGTISTSNFRFGVTTGNTTSANIKWGTSEFSDINAIILVVLKHEFSTNTSSVFINPVIGSLTEPTAETIEANPSYSGFVNRTSLNNFWFRNTGSSAAKFNISGARVSISWAKAVESLVTLTPLTTPTVGTASSITRNGFTANWTKVANAVSYDVAVYKGATLISTTNATGQATESQVVTGLTTGTTYT